MRQKFVDWEDGVKLHFGGAPRATQVLGDRGVGGGCGGGAGVSLEKKEIGKHRGSGASDIFQHGR